MSAKKGRHLNNFQESEELVEEQRGGVWRKQLEGAVMGEEKKKGTDRWPSAKAVPAQQ